MEAFVETMAQIGLGTLILAGVFAIAAWYWSVKNAAANAFSLKGIDDLPLRGPKMRPLVEVFFSPHGGAEEAIIEEINQAMDTIKIMAFYLTDKQIVAALTRASHRNVIIEAVLDDRGDNSPNLEALWQAGASCWVDKKHTIMHNKVMIIDGGVVITGSYNFSAKADERNAENLLILRSRTLARAYRVNWYLHRQHSELRT